ncbi:MAG TPA: glycosyltransferase family 39 protein [Candidatus Eisenbacteria bacterium]|nr:glycosyltransferase family 39 protein [Candidatus Eisenbacteria bacterium]
MQLLQKYVKEMSIGAGLLAAYLFLRLTQIMSLPLFTDEAIYTRWSQIAKQDANWRFISLTDGKQPMFVWWDMIFMRFAHDPLLAGRLVSVVCGLLTMVGLFLLGREIFKNKWVGILSAGLYVLYPFALVYDRMALYDSMVGMFTIWSLYLEIVLVRRPKLWLGFLLGLVLGGGMLTKTSAFFSWYLLPATVLLFDWKSKERAVRLAKWVGIALLAVVLANVYYSILRLSPFYHIVTDKNAVFVYPLNEWLQHPVEFFQGNFHGVWDWFSTYMTYPVLILLIGGLVVFKKYTKEKIVLVIYFVVPFFLLALFGRVLYPRFIFFMTLPLLPIVGLFLIWLYAYLKKPAFWLICLLFFFALWIFADFKIITNFATAPIAKSDLSQYSNDWPAGGGMAEVVNYLAMQSQTKKIYVGSEGTFGSLPTLAMEIYLGSDKNIEKSGIWPVPDEIPQDLLEKAKKMDTYFIFYQQPTPPKWPLSLIAQYKKGIGNVYYMRLYKVKAQ